MPPVRWHCLKKLSILRIFPSATLDQPSVSTIPLTSSRLDILRIGYEVEGYLSEKLDELMLVWIDAV